jgi:hypothetical protein
MRGYLLAATAAMALAAGPVHAANLLTNGDFSAGVSGFGSDYDFTGLPISNTGEYTVTAANNINSPDVNTFGDWTAVDTDPTGGTGNVLVAAGADLPDFTNVWTETVAVTPDTNYTFTFLAVDVNGARVDDAVIESAITGSGGPFTSGASINTDGDWQIASFTWNSGDSTSAFVQLGDGNVDNTFNDFAIADLSFTSGLTSGAGAVPETSTWVAMLIGFSALGFLGHRKTKTPAPSAA